MQKELGVGLDQIQWVSSIYLLTTCAVLLVFGRLGDIYGKVRFFQVGVAIFALGSLLCGMATTLEFLVLARAVQGVGCASAMANNPWASSPSRSRCASAGVPWGCLRALLPWE